jgi:hypothetical protein
MFQDAACRFLLSTRDGWWSQVQTPDPQAHFKHQVNDQFVNSMSSNETHKKNPVSTSKDY